MAAGLARRIAGRSAAFYAANLAALLLPLASVPYLARVLGPAGWGELAIAQAVATSLAALVEFGHVQSGTRALLRAGSASEAARIAGTILAGKLLLAALGALILAALGGLGFVPVRPALLVAAGAAGISFGLSPLWLVQAGERVAPFLALDVAAKALAVAALPVLVHGPGDAPVVLWLQAGAGAASLIGGLWLAPHRPAPRAAGTGEIVGLLRDQRYGFLFRATILTYTTANVFVLGLVAAAHEVGLFAAVDRPVRLVACFAGPLGQALYPLLARASQEDPAAAARLVGFTTLTVAAVGIVLSAVLFAAAEPIVHLGLGVECLAAAPVLRMLAPLPALICVSNILGIQWMFSIGAESAFVRILALAGAVCLPTGAVLGAFSGAIGMAGAALLAELVVAGGVLLHLAWTGRLPTWTYVGRRANAH